MFSIKYSKAVTPPTCSKLKVLQPWRGEISVFPPCSPVLCPVVSILTVGQLLRVGAEILLAVRGSVHGRVRVVRAGEDDGGGHVVQLVVGRETPETEC